MATNNVTLWAPKEIETLPATAKKPAIIIEYASQLSVRDKTQILNGFKSGSYEMAISYVWIKAMAALKRDLARVGMKFLGEILGRSNFEENTNPTSAISHSEAIMLAQEFGVVSATEAMRLRQSYEQITHFIDGDGKNIDNAESMDEAEALLALKACVRNILSKEKIEVATQFADFRSALERQVFKADAAEMQNLLISPYFFRKITLGILLNLARSGKGAQLENALANLNVAVPLLWPTLQRNEKFSVGAAYSTAYSEGAQIASAGLRSALLKVQGFDFVPENVRSHTFIKAAEKLIEAHEGNDNYYNEPGPTKELRSLGTTIPIPAFSACATAVMCVYLGNPYGICRAAQTDAVAILEGFTNDRWVYYLNDCLPTDSRMLSKLGYGKPIARLKTLVDKFELNDLKLNGPIAKLIASLANKNEAGVNAAVSQMRVNYYGKS